MDQACLARMSPAERALAVAMLEEDGGLTVPHAEVIAKLEARRRTG